MSANEWAALAVAGLTMVGGFATGVRFLVKHYLVELKPNGGGSMNDRMTRVEQRVDDIYKILLEK